MVLTLAVFSLKFSLDGRLIKDEIFKYFCEQKQLNLQWMGIFKRLPIGILVTKGNKVIHANKAMLKIVGQDQIEVFCLLLTVLLALGRARSESNDGRC